MLQEKTNEIESVKMEIVASKHEKQAQQARISELRSALKSSIQHHRVFVSLANFIMYSLCLSKVFL